ncbi:MAG: DUF819 family protein [Gammaproteobacteria bacterium]|nr:DUF819 family protein [Gammaproteobacteria bacterium]
MHETAALISSPIGVLAILCAVAGFFFYLERATGAKLFQYLPPLLFIYITPVILSNVDIGGASIIPNNSIIYSGLSTFALPAFIVLMLIKVDVPAVVRIMGKGVLVMLMGTAGVMAGGVISYMIVHRWLSDDAWTGFGALAGSWIGGTANMAATKEMLGTSSELFGLAVIADNAVYIVWLPLLLMSRNFAGDGSGCRTACRRRTPTHYAGVFVPRGDRHRRYLDGYRPGARHLAVDRHYDRTACARFR